MRIATYTEFAANAADASDYQKTVEFIKTKNFCPVMRNTGHDHIDKSRGVDAMSIWTHYMKAMQRMEYKSPLYTEKAIKVDVGAKLSRPT